MKQSLKRLFSVLIVIAMLVQSIPIPIFANETSANDLSSISNLLIQSIEVDIDVQDSIEDLYPHTTARGAATGAHQTAYNAQVAAYNEEGRALDLALASNGARTFAMSQHNAANLAHANLINGNIGLTQTAPASLSRWAPFGNIGDLTTLPGHQPNPNIYRWGWVVVDLGEVKDISQIDIFMNEVSAGFNVYVWDNPEDMTQADFEEINGVNPFNRVSFYELAQTDPDAFGDAGPFTRVSAFDIAPPVGAIYRNRIDRIIMEDITESDRISARYVIYEITKSHDSRGVFSGDVVEIVVYEAEAITPPINIAPHTSIEDLYPHTTARGPATGGHQTAYNAQVAAFNETGRALDLASPSQGARTFAMSQHNANNLAHANVINGNIGLTQTAPASLSRWTPFGDIGNLTTLPGHQPNPNTYRWGWVVVDLGEVRDITQVDIFMNEVSAGFNVYIWDNPEDMTQADFDAINGVNPFNRVSFYELGQENPDAFGAAGPFERISGLDIDPPTTGNPAGNFLYRNRIDRIVIEDIIDQEYVSARYVIYEITKSHDSRGVFSGDVVEIVVYGAEEVELPPPPPENLARLAGSTGIAINSHANFPASRLNNGNTTAGDRWSVDGNALRMVYPSWDGNVWVGADLGQDRQFNYLVVREWTQQSARTQNWVIEYATAEQMPTSPNNNNSLSADGWNEALRGTGGIGVMREIQLNLPVNARYVRLRTLPNSAVEPGFIQFEVYYLPATMDDLQIVVDQAIARFGTTNTAWSVESWNRLQVALTDAQAILDSDSTDGVWEARLALLEAMDVMFLAGNGDPSALQARVNELVAHFGDSLDSPRAHYLNFENYLVELEYARWVLASTAGDSVSQSVFDRALDRLNRAAEILFDPLRTSRADFDTLEDYFNFTVASFGGTSNRVFSDPNFISDEQFFGVWDGTSWTTHPLLDYSFVDPATVGDLTLAAVEAAARAGDYDAARYELLEYFRGVFASYNRGVEGNLDERTLLTSQALFANFARTQGSGDLSPLRHVAAIWSLNEQDNTFTADVTEDIVRATAQVIPGVVYNITSSRRGEVDAIFEHGAYITATVNGQARRWEVSNEVAVSAGSNMNTNFEGQPLRVNEHTSSTHGNARVNHQTWRTYLHFDFSDVNYGDVVENAILHINGSLDTYTPLNRDMLLWRDQALTFDQSVMTWHTVPQFFAFSWDGLDTVNHTRPPTTESPTLASWADNMGKYTYMFGAARNFRGFVDAGRQEEGEAYAYHSIRLIMGSLHNIGSNQLSVHGGGHNTGQRALEWPNLIDMLIDSRYMTPEAFTAMLKNIHSVNQALIGPGWDVNAESNNHGHLRAEGLLVNAIPWRQFYAATRPLNRANTTTGHMQPDSGWIASGTFRLIYKVDGDTAVDGSNMRESPIGYTYLAVSTTFSIPNRVAIEGYDFSTLYTWEEWELISRAAMYIMDNLNPTWGDWQIGNGYHFWRDFRLYHGLGLDNLFTLHEGAYSEYIRWWYTDGREGTRPPHTSAAYFHGRHATLRSDWMRGADVPEARGGSLPADIVAMSTVSDGGQRTHSHHDSTHLGFYAYGQHLLVGTSNFWGGGPWQGWHESAIAHNVMVVDGQTTFGTGWGSLNPGLANLNEAYDYLRVSSSGTPRMAEHYRDILFIRPEYAIVTDFLRPTVANQTNTFDQLWHTMPHAVMTTDHTTNNTLIHNPSFGGAPATNLILAPVNPSSNGLTTIHDPNGSFVPSANVRLDNTFLRLSQEATGAMNLNTVLFPFRAGETASVETYLLTVDGATEAQVSAFGMNITHEGHERSAHYFSVHDRSLLGSEYQFHDYITDARLAFIERDATDVAAGAGYNLAIIQDGRILRDEEADRNLIYAASPFHHLGVEWEDGVLQLHSAMRNTSHDIAGHRVPMMTEGDLGAYGLRIYMPEGEFTRAYLNGERVWDVIQIGDVVYFGDPEVEPSENLALNRPVNVSTYFNAQHNGDVLTDGITGGNNRWASAATDPEPWLIIDLEEAMDINRVVIYEWRSAQGYRASSFTIEISPDGTGDEWITVYEGTTIGSRGMFDFDTIEAHRVRVTFTDWTSAATQQPSIHEVEIYNIAANRGPLRVEIARVLENYGDNEANLIRQGNSQEVVDAYLEALAHAQIVLADPEATQAELDAARDALREAADALVLEVLSYSELRFEVIDPATGRISAASNGVILTSPAEVENGSEVAFVATPEDGYQLLEWRVNGEVVEVEEREGLIAFVRNLIDPTSGDPYVLILTITEGTDVTVEFEEIEDDVIEIEVEEDGRIEITFPDGDYSYTADNGNLIITIPEDGNIDIEVELPTGWTVVDRDEVTGTITIAPPPGYEIVEVDGELVVREISETPPPVCPEGESMNDDGECEPDVPTPPLLPVCPEGESLNDEGECESDETFYGEDPEDVTPTLPQLGTVVGATGGIAGLMAIGAAFTLSMKKRSEDKK